MKTLRWIVPLMALAALPPALLKEKRPAARPARPRTAPVAGPVEAIDSAPGDGARPRKESRVERRSAPAPAEAAAALSVSWSLRQMLEVSEGTAAEIARLLADRDREAERIADDPESIGELQERTDRLVVSFLDESQGERYGRLRAEGLIAGITD